MYSSSHGFPAVVPMFVTPFAVDQRIPPVLLVFVCWKENTTKNENISMKKTVKKLILASSLFFVLQPGFLDPKLNMADGGVGS